MKTRNQKENEYLDQVGLAVIIIAIIIITTLIYY